MTTPNPVDETILDYIDNIRVPGRVFDQPANEYWALLCWREGMQFLYTQVKRFDERTRQTLNPGGHAICHYGNMPEIPLICPQFMYQRL
jgi:hypothetical protein